MKRISVILAAVVAVAATAAPAAWAAVTVAGNTAYLVSQPGAKSARCRAVVGVNSGSPHAYITCNPGQWITIGYSVAGHFSRHSWWGNCANQAQWNAAPHGTMFYAAGREHLDLTFRGRAATNGLHCQVNKVVFS